MPVGCRWLAGVWRSGDWMNRVSAAARSVAVYLCGWWRGFRPTSNRIAMRYRLFGYLYIRNGYRIVLGILMHCKRIPLNAGGGKVTVAGGRKA